MLINAWPNGWQKSLVTVDRTPLPAFFAFADALTPLAVNGVTNRHAVYSGEQIEMELWLLNDTNETPEGMTIEYWLRQVGSTDLLNQADAALMNKCLDASDTKPLFIQQTEVQVVAMGAKYQGSVSRQSPQVTERTQLEFGSTLKNSAGEVIHRILLDLFELISLQKFCKNVATKDINKYYNFT